MASSITGEIISVKRLNNSTNGNPRWEICLSPGGAFKTQSDAAMNYEVNNPGYRVGDTVRCELSGRGTIRMWESVKR